jgi:hypothetical protein
MNMSKDLMDTFKTACGLFNDSKYDELRPLMDIDIIMKRVDDPGSVVGIGNVITYLNGKQAEKQPQFDVVKIETVRGENTVNGQVSGTAYYQDQKHLNTKIPVRFTFGFARQDVTDEWQLVNAFAAPVQ